MHHLHHKNQPHTSQTSAGGTRPGTAQDLVMSTDTGLPTAAAEARPVVLLRSRSGATGQTVHLVPVPVGLVVGQAGAAEIALCGALLCPDQTGTVRKFRLRLW